LKLHPNGAVRLARLSVPGTIRERYIVQLPLDDEHDRAGNSLVYGYGLRTLMSIGAMQRRLARAAIVDGFVNPHDPIDVVRWGLSRRMPASEARTTALALLDKLSMASRSTRALVARLGVNVRAKHFVSRGLDGESVGLEEQRAPVGPGSDWRGVAAAISTLEQLVEPDRAQLAGLLASGDLDIARAWAQENLMASER
jgi:hypothetical protein